MLSPLIVLIGPAIIATSPMLAIGSVAGLETSIFAALVTWAAYLVARQVTTSVCTVGAIFGGLILTLTTWARPEGIAIAALLICIAAVMTRGEYQQLRKIVFAGAIAGSGWLMLLAYRWLMFHHLQPNTYFAKMASDAIQRIFHGLNYVRDWAVLNGGFVLLAVAICAVFLVPLGRRQATLLCLAVVFSQLIIVIYEGGDWMPHLRMLVPMVGVLAAMVSAGIAAVVQRWLPHRSYFASLILAALLFGAFHFGLRQEFRRAMNEVQTRLFGWNDAHKPLALWLAEWESRRIQSGHSSLTVALMDIGRVGYESNVRIIDIIGLADPEWAFENYKSGGTRPYPAARLLARDQPDVIVLVSHSPLGERPTRWFPLADAEIAKRPEFWQGYTQAGVYTHKQINKDAYLLHVFIKNGMLQEAPKIVAPKARAVSN